MSHGRAIVYVDVQGENWIIPHELIHVYQYREHMILNTWLTPLSKKIKNKTINTIFSNYVYMDIPYFSWVYWSQYDKERNHYKNFYEFEAERFATNRFVAR